MWPANEDIDWNGPWPASYVCIVLRYDERERGPHPQNRIADIQRLNETEYFQIIFTVNSSTCEESQKSHVPGLLRRGRPLSNPRESPSRLISTFSRRSSKMMPENKQIKRGNG